MSGQTFRDAIADVIASASGPDWWEAASDAVLAMPEMQAIRKQLITMADDLSTGCNDDVNHGTYPRRNGTAEGSRAWRFSEHLSGPVIDWVMS